jgi:hypothetical protein
VKRVAEKLPNVPGKTITAVVVNYVPGKSGKHHHAGSVLAYVLSGAIRSENSVTGPSGRKLLRAAWQRASRQRKRQRDRAGESARRLCRR